MLQLRDTSELALKFELTSPASLPYRLIESPNDDLLAALRA